MCRVVGQHRSAERHAVKIVVEEGLQRPTSRKRKRVRSADGSVRSHRAEHPHQVWAMDFQFDAARPANAVVAVLEELTSLYPAPAFIRSDNGSEFIAQALRDWCEACTTTSTVYIEPGSP